MRRVTLRGLAARKLRLALTALAIVIGVTFVTGTLVLGDTLNRTFDHLVGNVYEHVSFEIRGDARLSGTNDAIDDTATRAPLPGSLVAKIRRLPGVAFAEGSVTGSATFLARDGSAINSGSSAGFSFDPDASLSALKLVSGHAPIGPDEVVMDKATARASNFRVGDRVKVLLSGPSRTFTISGIVTFGTDDDLAGMSVAAFDLPTAQRLFDSIGEVDTINVLAAHGASSVRLQRAIQAVLPPRVQVVSGQQVANQLSQSIHSQLSFLSTALLIFALISLFVGAFTIFNTFSITVSQRTRELALLRIVGASRGQLFRSVLVEAALMGLAASLIGLGLGVLAAVGLKALLGAFGIDLPSAPLVFEPRTAVVALGVGIGVTLISAIAPARRAVRIPPVAALAELNADAGVRVGRRRLGAGMVSALAGAALVVAGVAGPALPLLGLGAVAFFVAGVLAVPALSGPLASAVGQPVARLLKAPGRLGRANAQRNPRRTAQTSAALMIGLTLVATIAVLGASLSASAKQNVDSAVRASYVITGNGAISTTLPNSLSKLSGAKVTTVYRGQFELGGTVETLAAVSVPNLADNVNLHVASGSEDDALARGELLVDTNTARSRHLHVGSGVSVTFARTGTTQMRIGAIFNPNPLVGSYVVSSGYFLAHMDNPQLDAVLFTPGAESSAVLLRRLASANPNVTIRTRAAFEASEQKSINQLFGLVYVLLALAILVALIGIANTLMLSVFERTHEIGLLRAVGMQRPQVRRMILAESLIIALLGAIVGVLLGTGLGAAFASALRNSQVTVVAIPIPRLLLLLVSATLLGQRAAIWPARRAARLDVLSAIATE